MEAVRLLDVVDQGGEVLTELCQWVVTGAVQARSILPLWMAYPRPLQVNISAAWTVTGPAMASAAVARRVFM